jgi:hypothetical protein
MTEREKQILLINIRINKYPSLSASILLKDMLNKTFTTKER